MEIKESVKLLAFLKFRNPAFSCIRKTIPNRKSVTGMRNYFGTEVEAAQVNFLFGGVATVLHRYTGQDTISLLLQVSSTKCMESKYFKVISFDFTSNTTTLAELVNQSETKSSLLPFRRSRYGISAELKAGKVQKNFKLGINKESSVGSNFDIFVIQSGNSRKLEFVLNFATEMGLKIKSHATRFPSHVNNILEGALLRPNQPHITHRILSRGEENRILHHYNQIHPDDPKSLEGKTLLDIFYKNFFENGSKLALLHDMGQVEIRLSYEQLYIRATALASVIQSKESQIGSQEPPNLFIAAFFQQGIGLILIYIASLLLNKTLAVLHSSYTARQVESCLATLGNPILVTTEEKMKKINISYACVILIDETEQKTLSDENNNLTLKYTKVKENMQRNRIPYCFFTSGSTGPPKSVLITEKCILNKNYFGAKNFGLDASCKTMCLATPGFLLSLNDVWTTWLLGGTLYIPPETTRNDLDQLKPWIFKHEITNFFTSTAVADAILSSSAPSDVFLSKLKWIFFGGEKIQRVNLVGRKFNCCFSYGSTETYEISAMILQSGRDHELPSVGKTIPNVSAYVLDATLMPVPTGVKGDIYVSGIGLMEGYWGCETKGVILKNPFEPSCPMYKTGDVGYWSEGGDLNVTGRKDAQVKVQGIRLELGEVETVFQKFPGITQVAVVLRQIQSVKQLVAFCKREEDKQASSVAEIYNFLETQLQRHAIPAEIHFVHDFPKTVSGKVDRRALTTTVCNETEESDPHAEKNGIYIGIREIWAKVIGIPQSCIKPTSNFFFLGGNSMLACRMIRMVSRQFPRTQISQIYDFPVLTSFISSILTPGNEKIEIDFEKETQLNLKFQLTPATDTIAPSHKNSLISGVTGYFGPALLIELLNTTKQNVVCIIRARSAHEAEKRLMEAVEPYCHNLFLEKFIKGRVKIVAGDLTHASFGLEESDYANLCGRIDMIYHAAAEVNHMKSYAQLKDSTVVMTRNILQFAATGKLKTIHHMSSVAVFDGILLPKDSQDYVAQETALPVEINPMRMSRGYAQSKWVSEQLVWNAMAAGVPGVIYRLGEIGSHSTLPIVNKDDALSGFLQACQGLNKIPDVAVSVPFISLDAAAEWIVKISETVSPRSEKRKVFHIVKKTIKLDKFLTQEIPKVSLTEWESDFFEKTDFHRKQNVGAWLFLDAIKESQEDQDGRGFVMRNISFELCYEF